MDGLLQVFGSRVADPDPGGSGIFQLLDPDPGKNPGSGWIQESQICQKLFIFEQNFNKIHGENRIANPDPGFFQLLDPDP